MRKIRPIFVFSTIVFMLLSLSSSATHNRAGEILYEHTTGYTYKITIYTYCYTQTEADRDELELDCGDNTSKLVLPRTSKVELGNYIRKNTYIGYHTFSGPGTYVLYMEDPNRNDGVLNIPNSVQTVFSLKTVLTIGAYSGNNSSPILLNSSMDKAALGVKFVHNPGAYDPDGDSLSYKITTCLGLDGKPIDNYTFPPVTNKIYVDAVTGDYVWDVPAQVGLFNIAMIIEEWRNGVKIGQVLRDIQVEVTDTKNKPPVIDNIARYCIVADSLLQFNVSATDPEGDYLSLTATGRVFDITNPATFDVPAKAPATITGTFSWQTYRNHIRQQPYDVLFRAQDYNEEAELSTYAQSKITVIAPKPEITSISSTNSSVDLRWNPGGNYNAVGYKIYRTARPDDFEPDVCQTGMPSGYGYVHIATLNSYGDTTFTDSNNGHGLASGFRYCYRVTAMFADSAESIVSDKECTLLAHAGVTLTNVSITSTDSLTGSVDIKWIKPEDLDQEVIKPPYMYMLFPNHGIYTNAYQIEGIDNTEYNEKNVDTKTIAAQYKITFTNYDSESGKWNGIGAESQASSPFLTFTTGSREVTINCTADVPWKNDTFVVYRKNPDADTFDSIGYSLNGNYTDRNLENYKTYGYKFKTVGFYSEPGLPSHIENFSQEIYATPIDTVGPCISINLESNCSESYNLLTWSLDSVCGTDVKEFYILYSPTLDGTLEQIDKVSPETFQYKHFPSIGPVGCYLVTAVDSSGNKSGFQAKSCIDNCEYYRLPNVFTPNGDGINDLFHPYPYDFVLSVEMTVTNRWGNIVFETTDPDLNWNGTDQSSGKKLPDGVYYYRCTVEESRLSGPEKRDIDGFITIFSKENPIKK